MCKLSSPSWLAQKKDAIKQAEKEIETLQANINKYAGNAGAFSANIHFKTLSDRSIYSS